MTRDIIITVLVALLVAVAIMGRAAMSPVNTIGDIPLAYKFAIGLTAWAVGIIIKRQANVPLMTIPADVYRSILHDTHIRYMRHGMTGPEAAAKAQELMDSAFVCEDVVLQDELQPDNDENGKHG